MSFTILARRENNANRTHYHCLKVSSHTPKIKTEIKDVTKGYNWIVELMHKMTPSDQIRSVTQLCLTLRPHESQHARPPCPSPTPGVHPDSRPLSQWCHPAISSSVFPFSSCPQSLPASGAFPMSQLFAWGGQSTGVSALASFLPKNTQIQLKFYIQLHATDLLKRFQKFGPLHS